MRCGNICRMNFIEKSKQRAYSIDVTFSKEQKELTQKYILPIIDELMDLIILSRKEFDREYLALNSSDSGLGSAMYGEIDINHYPIGHCSIIRDGVFEKISKSAMVEDLLEKGVLFKHLFVILDANYTQNAIQLGNLFIDVANDTVNPKKEAVYCEAIEDIDFENLDDYQSYYEMVESYLNIKLYPNRYIPQIADIFPMIALDCEGQCSLFMHQEIILYKDISQNFALARGFRESNSFQDRALPELYINLLHSLKNHISFGQFGTPSELLDRYFEADDELLKSFFIEMFESELLTTMSNLGMMLNLHQGDKKIPSYMLDIFRSSGIIPARRAVL